MVKSKLLTPILAGVLGVSVVGSSVGYVLVNKDDDGGKKDSKTKSKTAVVSPADKLSDGAGIVPGLSGSTDEIIKDAEAAIKGELDFAYDADLKVSFSDKFKEMSGADIGNFGLKTSTKQKGDKAAADFTVNYNDNDVVSLNTVYDRATSNVYVQIPQLSNDYLYMNVEEFITTLEDQMGTSLEALLGQFDAEGLEQALDFDPDEIAAELQGYIDAFTGAMPAPTDGKDVSGDVEGYDYTYTTKTYTITGTDLYNMVKAVADKAKTDSALSDLYTQLGGESETGMSYGDLIDGFVAELDDLKSGTDSVTFDIYYNQDNFAGFSFKQDSTEISLKTVLTEAVTAVDFKFTDGLQGFYFNGSSEYDDGATNGAFNFSTDIDSTKIDIKYTLSNVNENGGSVRFDMSYDDGSQAVSGWIESISTVTDDSQDVTLDIGYNGDSMVSFSYKMQKTEASDITVPTGTMYNIANDEEVEAYIGNCDTATFLANFKSIIGEDLYNSLFGSTYDYDDDDWDDDDYLIDYDYDNSDIKDLETIIGEVKEENRTSA